MISWAAAKKITWCQAAAIIDISDRQIRRWRERYEQYALDGLLAGREAGAIDDGGVAS